MSRVHECKPNYHGGKPSVSKRKTSFIGWEVESGGVGRETGKVVYFLVTTDLNTPVTRLDQSLLEMKSKACWRCKASTHF